MYNKNLIDRAIELKKENKNNSQIAKEIGVPRTTIISWFKRIEKNGNVYKKQEINFLDIEKNIGGSYSYILGMYLGDGHISKCLRTYRFRIFQDSTYKDIIDNCVFHLKKIFPNNIISIFRWHCDNCKVIILYNNNLAEIFPQHGPGKKHLRKIELLDWQKEIINKYPREFLCGLIDSDGCRFLCNNYLYYQFTNKSEDIKDMFCDVCKILGIEYLRYNKYKNIRISKRKSVEKIEKIYEELDQIYNLL